MATETPTRRPDSEIDPREVIDANWDSDTPDTESWRIVTKDENGHETVHHSGTDLGLAVRLGYHREAARIHDDHARARDEAANAPERERKEAEFQAWQRSQFEASQRRQIDDGDRAEQPQAPYGQ